MTNKTTILIVCVITIIISIIGYIIIRFQEEFMVGLIKENAIHHCETIKGSVRYHMLENRKEDVKQIIETIGLQNQITEIRIFDKRGKIIVSSKNTNVGVSVDKDAEGCNSCHVEDKELLKQREIARIYKTTDDERLIGVMHPIYNEKQCFNCHPQSQKILGMLDVVLSLKETDAAISRNKKMLFLFFFITVLLISFIIGKYSYDLQKINRKLRQTNERKSKFILKVAHQLRAPVSAIQSCLKVVTEGYAPKEIHMDMISRAENRTRTIIPLINDLLDLAKTEELTKPKQKEYMDFKEMLSRTVAMMKEKAESKKIALSLKMEGTLPPIKARPEDIDDVFSNIIDNAIKYTPPDGKVEVIAKTDDEKIKVEIQDTGVGIPEGDIHHIFDEFYRAENIKKIEKEGTGLGLAIARKIIETYCGKIEVESKVNEGTKFIVVLPVS
ncbi:MAG: HAMP domain-containing histidine kinase [Bacteroidales bacterium]|nr:HAMP domain-containing histidine kinase [Bacteroidales bacterium]